MGKLIVIEGLDGSGKTTQTAIVAEELRRQGKDVKVISFPDYKSPSASLVNMYLQGDFGERPSEVNAYAASSFYAVDRYASYNKEWKEFYERTDSIVLATRYTTSNEIYQLAKIKRDDWDDFIDWAEDFEYGKLGLPQPDAVFYLDMKYEIAKKLIDSRSAETGQAKDIHELDDIYMQQCHKAAAYALGRLGWKNIVCYSDKAPLTPEEITETILTELVTLLDMS
ncbi:MAG: deoxynucleoside kinase [Clostridia bacterium]|nr:deoxynucleoside kinase [Clostridia bacterium]